MSQEINIPDGLWEFRMGEKLIKLDPIETIMECNAISDRTKDTTNFEYLDEFRTWLNAQCDEEFTRGQAHALWQAVHIEHARSAKSFTDALKSLSSTGSTPSV